MITSLPKGHWTRLRKCTQISGYRSFKERQHVERACLTTWKTLCARGGGRKLLVTSATLVVTSALLVTSNLGQLKHASSRLRTVRLERVKSSFMVIIFSSASVKFHRVVLFVL